MLRLWFNALLVANWFGAELGLATPVQVPLEVQPATKPKKLRGRFLHITDMHPDPYYTPKTAKSTACHRKKKKKKKKNIAGYYGTPYSDCDSPFRLTNFTLDFLKENWAKEIDFVIWTGDSARHDNDRKLPRTPSEIYDLNRAVAARMHKIFHSKGIPVVPTLGNNDVWRPNSITMEYASIWSPFIPFPYLQVFHRGAYFATEVVPGKVAVISLNTMYFYDSNKVVTGCPYKDRNDPGNLQLDWLEVQLDMYRRAGLQVWLIGHVPPAPGNYFPECYVRYVELALRFQDTILGHLFGVGNLVMLAVGKTDQFAIMKHMNADHFFFLEAQDLRIFPDEEEKKFNGKDLLESLLEDFATLPKNPTESDVDEYAVVNVAPSVVPNPYLPSFRIYSYNITGGKEEPSKQGKRKHGHRRGSDGNNSTCKSVEYADTWRCHLSRPWHSDPDSPSRSNRRWTPLGYAQYYIPKLEKADKTEEPRFELEYVTYTIDALHPKGDGGYPVPLKYLPEELKKLPAERKSKYVPYKMVDLTIGSWMRLGRALGDEGRGKLRKRFRRYMFME